MRLFDFVKGELCINLWYFNGFGIDCINDLVVFDKRNNLILCGILLFYIFFLLFGIDLIYFIYR